MSTGNILRFVVVSCFFLAPYWVKGQVKLTKNFSQLLEKHGIDFVFPVENTYKAVPLSDNSFLDYQFAIKSRKEKMEIRYYLEEGVDTILHQTSPYAACMRMVLHLATNEQDAVFTVLELDEKTLKESFNADWGRVVNFQPKAMFSEKKHCQMIAIFKENQGMAYIFLLFDKAEIHLENRFVALSFQS